jgi:hypothetical protein
MLDHRRIMRVAASTVAALLLSACDEVGRNNYHLAAVAYSPDHAAVFVANADSGAIDVLRVPSASGETGPRFVGRLTEPRRKHVLRLSVDGSRERLWVASPEAVYLYELRQLTLQRVFDIPRNAYYERVADLVLDQAGNAYVLVRGGARILRVDARTLELARWLDVASSAREGAIALGNRALLSRDGKSMFVASAENPGVLAIELQSKRVERIATPDSVDFMCALLFWRKDGEPSAREMQHGAPRLRALDCFDSWQADVDLGGEARVVESTGNIDVRRGLAKTTFPPGY